MARKAFSAAVSEAEEYHGSIKESNPDVASVLQMIIDIDTLYNPYIKTLDDGTLLIQPATGEPYCDRSWDCPYKITHDDLCFKLFTEAGFEWGGDWTTRKDYQHFEVVE